MGIKVMAYNTLDGFGDELRVDRLLALIREEAPNLAFFSEAYEASRDMESVKLKLNRMGYEVVLAPYDDDDERSDRAWVYRDHQLPEQPCNASLRHTDGRWRRCGSQYASA